MKTIDPATQALLNTGDFMDVDLYTITMMGGGVLRYAAADFTVSDGVHTWRSDGVMIGKDTAPQGHWKTGLDVDTWQVTMIPRPLESGVAQDFIGTVGWLEAVTNGALDGAELEVSRAFYAAPPTQPIPPTGAPLVGARVVIFAGLIMEVDSTHMMAHLTAKDYRVVLERQIPPHLYQASCRFTLFDPGCGLSAAAFAVNRTVASATKTVIIPTVITPPAGSGTFRLGRVVFTSGKNNAFQRMVQDWNSVTGAMTMVSPWPYQPQVGDTFQGFPGCDKTQVACALFGNSINFGGAPFVPAAETAV